MLPNNINDLTTGGPRLGIVLLIALLSINFSIWEHAAVGSLWTVDNSIGSMRSFWISRTAVGCVFALLLTCVPDASTLLKLSLNGRIRNTLRVRCEDSTGTLDKGATLRLNTTTPQADCFSVTHSNDIMSLNFTPSCEGALIDYLCRLYGDLELQFLLFFLPQ